MFKRLAMLATTALLAAACASSPTTSSSPAAPAGPAADPAPAVPAGTATVANLAGSTWWYAEEKLIPDDPVLALVNDGSTDTDQAAGVSAVCRAANGNISLHIGKQPGARLGQTATFRVRAGASARDVAGKFQAGARAGETDFVFPITSADLLAMGQQEMVSFVSDQGETQWALVKQADAQVQARYVGSMKNFSRAAADFLNYCNPK